MFKLHIFSRKLIYNLMIPVFSILSAIVVGGIIISAMGNDPILAYQALLKGAFGNTRAILTTISRSVILMFTGLAVAFAFKSRAFNIGAEGQMLVGALVAGLAGVYLTGLPAIIHLPLVLLLSVIAGAVWAFFPAFFKVTRNVHIVISTIMFNYIALYIVQYLALGPFQDPGPMPATSRIAETAMLPWLVSNVLNYGIVIAISCMVIIYLILERTRLGYEIKAVGISPSAAEYNGIDVKKTIFISMLISGALAGLGGGLEVVGNYYRFVDGFSPGYGFTGIPVALLARNNPFAIILSAILLGALNSGAIQMQVTAGVSAQIAFLLQGIIILFIASENAIRWSLNWFKEVVIS